uniref:Carcinoembryonic antigen-related cell adhesion molecule 6-like n=1 Tax=Bos indicus x Bos taurus TaxID=30522 RepID=A0A4W2HW73_BOBOX
MEPPSGPASRRHVPWNRLLLAVSLLTFWTPPTTAQLTIETMPPLAAEGSDILLLAHNLTENPLAYAWYRGERVDNSQLIASYRVDTNATTKGPAHSGRETLYPNGTLLIQSVTQKDTGSYTLLVTKDDLQTERQTGHLHVLPVLPTPVITSNNSKPWEHKDTVVLTCGPETQNTSYMWWISNQSLPKSTRLKLSEDKRTLTVFNVTRKEKGPYVCETRNLVSISRSDPFTLDVLYSSDHPEGNLNLSCHTASNPATQRSPLLSVRPQEYTQALSIPNHNMYSQILHSLTVLDSPTSLLCLSTDPVARPSLQVSNTTVPEHEGPVVLTCLTDETGVSIRWLFKGQSLLLADRMTLSSDNSTLTIDPVSREDAGDYQCEVSNRGNSSRSGPLSRHVQAVSVRMLVRTVVIAGLLAHSTPGPSTWLS